MEHALDVTYRGFRWFLEWIVGYGAAIIMLGATCLAILEICRRYVFGLVYDWGQDAVTYYMVSAIFLFFAVTQARRSHLAMSAFVDWLRSRGRHRTVVALRLAVTVISLTFFGLFAFWGIPSVERSLQLGRMTQSMVLPIWPFQAALLAGFVLMFVATLFHLYQDIQALRGKTVFPWAETEEGLDI